MGYRLNSGAEKAKNDIATAVCGGIRGNALSIVVENNVDGGYIVKTLLDSIEQHKQIVLTAEESQNIVLVDLTSKLNYKQQQICL